MQFETPTGATPLTPEDLEGLRVDYLTTYAQLNELEAANIGKAMRWAITSRIVKNDLLAMRTVLTLHKHMFSDVWRWAGTLRRREANIGSPPEQLAMQYGVLEGNARYWIQNQTYLADSIRVIT